MIYHQKFGLNCIINGSDWLVAISNNLNVLLSATTHDHSIIAVLPALFCKYFWAASWTALTHSVAKCEMLWTASVINISQFALFVLDCGKHHSGHILSTIQVIIMSEEFQLKNVVLVGWYSQIILVINIRKKIVASYSSSWAKLMTSNWSPVRVSSPDTLYNCQILHWECSFSSPVQICFHGRETCSG